MPTESASLSIEQAYAEQAFTPIAVTCGCPVCTGAAMVAEGGEPAPQAYLNADQRGIGTASNGKISLSSYDAAKRMTGFDPVTGAPYPGWGSVGQPFTVTYAFRSSEPARYPDDAGGFSRFTDIQIFQTELALQSWADVARITFVRVGSGTSGEEAYSNSATMLFANYSTGIKGASAFALYPGSTSFGSSAGDVWVNSTIANNNAPAIGNSGHHALVHEIGHAIGLAHPGDYDATDGEEITYAAHAEYYEDSRQYSVMSYFASTNTGASLGTRFAAAPQLDDIRAAQIEYGPNYATRSGDTVYGFNSTAEREWYAATSSSSRVVFAVWDGGGSDTLDFSGYSQNGQIDLREGFFSSVGGLIGNVAIAHGTVIENAKGGSGADSITGNATANSLYGGLGSDTLDGGAGSDFLRGEEGDDLIFGAEAFDDVHGNMGNDTVFGGGGGDWVVGGKDQDLLYGDDGGDIVWGNLGNDTQYGGLGNDQVRGGQGDDIIYGEWGDDYVSGDRGNDTVYGGSGADYFHGSQDQGIDRVMDFNRAEGDIVLLDPGTTYTVYQLAADVIVDTGGGNQMILVGVQLSTLTTGWIVESWTYG